VQGDDEIATVLRRYECVEWLYDGLNGKIIPWTKEHGNTNEDPSVLAFVVTADGTVLARAPDAVPYQAGSFSKWLAEQAAVFEREHPRLRLPFVLAELSEEEPPTCPALDRAREDRKPVLLYFGREAREDATRAEKRETKSCRALEKKALDSKSAARAAEGLVLLRFDLGAKPHAAFAKGLGVDSAPALLLWHPDAEKPEDLGDRISGSSLAYRLNKARSE
jgi:hypothetical protein